MMQSDGSILYWREPPEHWYITEMVIHFMKAFTV
jgi:hypothetical protein